MGRSDSGARVVGLVLAHHGVKGMRWGVRKERSSSGGPQPLNRAEKKHVKKALSTSGWVKVHNAAAGRMNNVEIARINNKPQYKDKDFTEDSPLRRKYFQEYEDTFSRIMVEEYQKNFGTAKTGRKLNFSQGDNGDITFTWADARHATGDVTFVAKTDDKGQIVSIKIVDDSMMQSDVVEQILQHHGVKGMKWGVRHTPGGGTTGTPTADARAADASKKKIDSGGTHSLTTQELQSLVNRMNLEQQYSRLVLSQPTTIDKGHNQVKKMIAIGNTGQQIFNLATSPAAKAGFALVKTALLKR